MKFPLPPVACVVPFTATNAAELRAVPKVVLISEPAPTDTASLTLMVICVLD